MIALTLVKLGRFFVSYKSAFNSRSMKASSLRTSASLAVLCFAMSPVAVYAQDAAVAAEPEEEEILVKGIRASLAGAQNIKQDSDTVVDAITAEDIGALPDRSVTEALQRVPGIAINRFAGSNNSDSFSVEGSGVLIRGLTFVRAEFNGRDAFAANGGRQLGFADVSPEFLSNVIVSKNLTAEMIEGGLAGTVNLITRVPFDKKGLQVGFTLEGSYSDFAKKTTPQGSLLVSNTWDTGAGTFGLLGSVSYSRLKGQADGVQVTNIETRTNLPGASGPDGIAGNADDVTLYAPIGGQFRRQEYDRDRTGISVAGQWESSDGVGLLTLQYTRADSTLDTTEHTFETLSDQDQGRRFLSRPLAGTEYTYNDDGVFESGYITDSGEGWRSGDTNSPTAQVPTGGAQTHLAKHQVHQETRNEDFGVNLKLKPTDRLTFNFDAQYTKASLDNLDFTVFGSNFADTEVDLTGKLPSVIHHKPTQTRPSWATPNPALESATDAGYFLSKDYTFWRAAMDHVEQSDGDEFALRADGAYEFGDESFLKRVKFGTRFTAKDQTVRDAGYNWGTLSEIWGGNPGSAVFMNEFGGDRTQQFTFDNFFRGDTNGPLGGNYYSGDLVKDYQGSSDFFQSIYAEANRQGFANAANAWRPLALGRARDGNFGTALGRENELVPGTVFLASDISRAKENSNSAYAMLSFGNDRYAEGLKISGNVGIRYVTTRLSSVGSVRFADGGTENYTTACAPIVNPDPNGPPTIPSTNPICTLTPERYAQIGQFLDGNTSNGNVAKNSYSNWLPSLNLKLQVNPELQFRVAASRAMARPDFKYISNFQQIGGGFTQDGYILRATGDNPYLKPQLSDQFDVSAEWYFDKVGSITVAGFYKSLKDMFYDSVTRVSITNNGRTESVLLAGPSNFSDGRGKIKGFEVGYQQTYDFLPGFLSGLGFSGNYTYVTSKGIPTNLLDVTSQTPTVTPGTLPLEQLSKHTVNASLFYEKGPLSLRGSYNWRSRFLLNARDNIYPYFPIYHEATGQLDASIFYSVTPNVKIAIQAVNLLNETVKTEQQFTASGLTAPRSYFTTDRRVSFGIRGSF